VLIERPDIMTLLATHPELSAKLGALYRGSPQLARETLDRHHLKMVEENELAVTAWREMIEEDPEARDELVESAERFADEEGYKSPSEATALTEPTPPHYYHHPYPYWFGTPYWHLAVHWYPHHAHWGFGYYADGSLWVFGLPSAAFSYWHFGYPSYYGHYPRLHRRWSHHRGDHHYRRHASRDHDRGSYRRDVPRRKHSDNRRDSHDVESVSRRHDPSGGVRRERRPGNYPDMSVRRGREARETAPPREQRKQVAERGTQRVRQKEEKSGTRRVGDKKSRSRRVHADKGGARRSHKAKGRAHGSQRAKSSGQRRAGGRMARR